MNDRFTPHGLGHDSVAHLSINFMPLAPKRAKEGREEKEADAAKGGAKGGGRVLAKAASEDVQEPGTTAHKHAGSQMRLIWIAGFCLAFVSAV